jgi:archaeosine synthase
MLHPAAHYDVGVTGHWDANEREIFGRQLERLCSEDSYKKAVVHAGSASKMLTVLLQERGIEVLDTGAERPASGAGLNALGAACRTALRGVASLSGHNRSRGEATGLAQVQFGELAASLLTAPVQGRWPRLRLGDLANFSPRIGGFALTVQGAAKLVEAGGPVIKAGKFQLRGDLFAAGVTGVRGEFRNGDQVAVEQGGEITAVGIARMAPREMVTMERGLAVEVRNRG